LRGEIGMKTLHEAILGKELMQDGFQLREDKGSAYLYLNGCIIGTYNACTVTMDTLRYDAVLALNEQQRINKL